MKTLRPLLLLTAIAVLAGCQTVTARRISAHRETWDSLSAQNRQRLLRGLVLVGDTEAMVQIALGPADRSLVITRDGRTETLWQYERLEDTSGSSPLDASRTPHFASRTQTVIFSGGLVVKRSSSDDTEIQDSEEFRASQTAHHLMTRLDDLVSLSPAQRIRAHAIFISAQHRLLALDPSERPIAGRPIREKMRADIRTILSPSQQAAYDAAPESAGGGGAHLARL